MTNKLRLFTVLFIIIAMNSCAKTSNGAQVVKPFEVDRYLGKWYEIARFDFRFERNLDHTTATYSMNPNGTIKVLNEGYDYIKKKHKKAVGKAKFAASTSEAALKVSFFGPFYAPYNVIALDSDYKYALVVGNDFNYMWILSRETNIPENVKQSYLKLAGDLGFRVDQLIWVNQN